MKKVLFLAALFASASVLAQNVGIGTPTPTEKLQVAGNIKLDTIKPNAIKLPPGAGNGKILTSDAAGNASWQADRASTSVGFGSWGDCSTNNISEYNPVADPTGANGDNFGISVSVSGNYAIVGALLDNVGLNVNQGSASIFQYNGSNWVFMQKIVDPGGQANDFFGRSVSLSGNYAIVGSYGDDVNTSIDQGSACIYIFNGTGWIFLQKITDALGAAGDQFGISVSISDSYAVVGAITDDVNSNVDQGSACIYKLSGSNWAQMQKITDAAGAFGDNFGNSVSVSGSFVIIGANKDDGVNATNQGSASIYAFNGAAWVLMTKVLDGSGSLNEQFGSSVSIFGNYAIIGADEDDVGTNASQGSASIYQYNGSSWVLMQKITDANGAADDQFGVSVSISGNYAIVGALTDDVGANQSQGSASIYLRIGQGWQKVQYISDPGGNAEDFFGISAAIDGATKRFLIGASFFGAGGSGKAVFGKIN